MPRTIAWSERHFSQDDFITGEMFDERLVSRR